MSLININLNFFETLFELYSIRSKVRYKITFYKARFVIFKSYEKLIYDECVGIGMRFLLLLLFQTAHGNKRVLCFANNESLQLVRKLLGSDPGFYSSTLKICNIKCWLECDRLHGPVQM